MRKALVIDREPETAEAIAYLLRELKFEVAISLRLDRESLTKCSDCDLIVVELDTDEDLERFSNLEPKLNAPTVINSADPYILSVCQERGLGTEYVQKPFNILDFEHKVQGVVALYY